MPPLYLHLLGNLLSTRLFTAKYLRTTKLIPFPKLPAASARTTKEERRRVMAEDFAFIYSCNSSLIGAVIAAQWLVDFFRFSGIVFIVM